MADIVLRVSMYSALGRHETIFALSSGMGKCAISVIRISGAQSREILESMTSGRARAREAQLTTVRDPMTGEIVDQGLAIWFPAPNSFTGEDLLELQLHGSRAVIAKIFSILRATPGVRVAQPGEFSRRALENGKFDLIATEALADLIDADTEAQRKLALMEKAGALRVFGEGLRNELIGLMADLEIALDFADEVDLTDEIGKRVRSELKTIEAKLSAVEAGYASAERVRDGLTVLIAGAPNAGKSSLLNALARREVAIVSEIAGTTRDLVEVRLDLGGLAVNLIDTAGMRSTDDPIEREGVRRALEKARSADLVLWLSPANEAKTSPPATLANEALWIVRTKSDLSAGIGRDEESDEGTFFLSAHTGFQLDRLLQALRDFAEKEMSINSSIIVANERQWRAVAAARDAVEAASQPNLPPEVIAEELRRASFALENLLGKIGVENVLDSVFSRFCIGK
jgi:tRNA modification GTPase